MSALPLPTPQSNYPWTGLATFLGRWQMNDFLFMIVHENLRRPARCRISGLFSCPRRGASNSTIPHWLPCRIIPGVPPGIDPAFAMTQLVIGAVLLGLTVVWAWRVWRQPELAGLLRAAFLTLAWGWLLSSAESLVPALVSAVDGVRRAAKLVPADRTGAAVLPAFLAGIPRWGQRGRLHDGAVPV